MLTEIISRIGRPAEKRVEVVIGTRDAPPEVLARTTLGRVDYFDLFTMATAVTATPEAWARAMFGDEPSRGEQLIWRVVLGLRLATGRSPATVAGWSITGRGPDWVRLEAVSPLLTVNLVVRTGGAGVALATYLRHDRRAGRWIWTPVSAVHRILVPIVLRSAENVVARRGSPAG